MDKEKELKLILVFTWIYLIFFILLAVVRKNYEFVFYIAVICLLTITTILHHKELHLKPTIVGGLSVIGLMHLAGGNLHFNGIRLYDIYLFQSFIRYDQIVHTLGFFVATFVSYSLIRPYLDTRMKHHPLVLSIILILTASGFGAINEVLEFAAVIFLGAAQAVGDYYNNAWDLVFNMLGAIAACIFIHPYHKRTRSIKRK